MNIWHDIDENRIKKNDFIACIEIPKGSKNKYEMDKETGLLILDRILYTSTHYPANYGFIPKTLSDDGDPLDVLVICSEVISSMALVRCSPIGVISMLDDGMVDHKIIAIPYKDPMWNMYQHISELPPHIMDEMTHFLNVYKQLEYKTTTVLEVREREFAEIVIEQDNKQYHEKFDKKVK